MTVTELVTTVFTFVVAATPAVMFILKYHHNNQVKVETLKNQHSKYMAGRLDEDVKNFRNAIRSIQVTISELNSALVQNRADVALLKERLDDTKKAIEQYEKTSDTKVRNIIKSEITNLTQQLMLIRTKKAP